MLWLTDHFRDFAEMVESANNFSIQYVFKFMCLWCKEVNTCERTQDAGALPAKHKFAAVSQLAEGADLKSVQYGFESRQQHHYFMIKHGFYRDNAGTAIVPHLHAGVTQLVE